LSSKLQHMPVSSAERSFDRNALLSPLMPTLRRGVRIAEVKATAKQISADPDSIAALLDMLRNPEEYASVQIQKGAWLLHHAFQLDERSFLQYRAELGAVLDATEDPSALRELLKLLASPIWTDVETEDQRTDLLELGLGMLHLTDLSLAISYTAMQLVQSRAASVAEYREGLVGLQTLRARWGDENQPLHRCIVRYESRFRAQVKRLK